MRKTLFILGGIAALLLSACTGESGRPVATGEGMVRAINAIPTAPPYAFLIEERSLALVDYATASGQASFDDLEYIFNFEVRLPDEILAQRVASSAVKVEKEFETTFVISGDTEAPTIIVWEQPIRIWTDTDSGMQARFGHTAASLGSIDVYFAPPGIPPAAGQAVGTLSFGEILAGTEYPASEHIYTITSAGNPGDILFTSPGIDPGDRIGFLITVFDATANDPGPLAARFMIDGLGTTTLPDAGVSSTVRFVHAAATLETSDVYTDELLLDQIVSNHAFRDVTGDIDLANGTFTLSYTPTGNVGSILVESDIAVFPATHNQAYVVGAAGAQVAFLRSPDRRSVETLVKFTLLHTATNHPLIDFYVVEAGTDIEDVFPFFSSLAPDAVAISANLDAGDLEMYVTVVREKTIIAGPVALTTALGDVLEYIIYDNVDPATADLVLIPAP